MAEDRRSRLLILGAATNWLAFAAQIAVSFMMAPYLIHTLGDTKYGVWSIIESVLAYCLLLDLGLAACVVRDVARFKAKEQIDEMNQTCSSCMLVFMAAGGLILFLGLCAWPFLSPSLEPIVGGSGRTQIFLALLAVNFATALPLSIFPAILDGMEQFALKSVVRVVMLALRVSVVMSIPPSQFGLLELAYIHVGGNLLEGLILAALAYRLWPALHLSWRFIDSGTLKRVRGYSLDAFLILISGRIAYQTDAIIIGLFLPFSQVAYFTVAARVIEFAKGLMRAASQTLTPSVSACEAVGDTEGLRKLFFRASRALLYLAIPMQLGLMLFGWQFLHLWIRKPTYADVSYPLMLILGATLALVIAQSACSRVLYGLGHLKWFSRLSMAEAGLNLALSLALVLPLGTVGVALGTAIPSAMFCVAMIVFVCRVLNVSLWEYGRNCLARPLLASCPLLAGWLVMANFVVIQSWLTLASVIGLGLIGYLIGVVALEFRLVRAMQSLARLVQRYSPIRLTFLSGTRS